MSNRESLLALRDDWSLPYRVRLSDGVSLSFYGRMLARDMNYGRHVCRVRLFGLAAPRGAELDIVADPTTVIAPQLRVGARVCITITREKITMDLAGRPTLDFGPVSRMAASPRARALLLRWADVPRDARHGLTGPAAVFERMALLRRADPVSAETYYDCEHLLRAAANETPKNFLRRLLYLLARAVADQAAAWGVPLGPPPVLASAPLAELSEGLFWWLAAAEERLEGTGTLRSVTKGTEGLVWHGRLSAMATGCAIFREAVFQLHRCAWDDAAELLLAYLSLTHHSVQDVDFEP